MNNKVTTLIDIIAGARPNFVKIAPIIAAMEKIDTLSYRLIHTGQHYSEMMSGNFFKQLNIPTPDINLDIGSGSQAEQVGKIMLGYEVVLLKKKSDLCLVVGDVNSTMACAITARKLGVRVAHVEAGIRSRDWTMPEEINRVVTDSISDLFFTTSETANSNLIMEGVNRERIYFVGNTMIDTLLTNLNRLKAPSCWDELDLEPRSYIVLTLHRPGNVDLPERLSELISNISVGAGNLPVIFPVHPRTEAQLRGQKLPDNLKCIAPLGYLEFNFLLKNCVGVITDSGGITEEATVLGVPCISLRDNTERPETVSIGTNELVGSDREKIIQTIQMLLAGTWKKGGIPPLWDGKSAQRIAEVLRKMSIEVS